MPARCLEVEITETAAMSDADRTSETLLRLRALGVHVSIDDFGTGYSSLDYLSELPFVILKMDGLFVRRLGQRTGEDMRARPYASAEAIVAMAHRLELKVIAECVEEAEILARLRDSRVGYAQGLGIAAPVPIGRSATLRVS